MKKNILLTFLLSSNLLISVCRADQTATLLNQVRFDIVINGSKSGEITASKGTKVTILREEKEMALILLNTSTNWVMKSDLDISQVVAIPAPKPALKPLNNRIASEIKSNIINDNNYLLDVEKMIPLRDQKYRGYDFGVSLSGDAIRGSFPYEINFDTGSWTTSLPYGCLNKARIKILERNIKDPWGVLSDKVQGQLALTSKDGKTKYTIDDYIFFARKTSVGLDADNDSTSHWGNSILGSFPSKCPWNGLPSLPFALACKYSSNGIVGMGIVSASQPDINNHWASLKSYLYIGSGKNVTSNLNWCTNLPSLYDGVEFQPYAIPGFKVVLNFNNNENISSKYIVMTNLLATPDTGAPELALRLDMNSLRSDNPYYRFFTDKGPEWRDLPDYREKKSNSKCLLKGINVTIEYTGSAGTSSSYSFITGDYYSKNNIPNHAIVGNKNGNFPWEIRRETPANRINLGNTLYYFCPVIFWDITNKRVGLYNFKQ